MNALSKPSVAAVTLVPRSVSRTHVGRVRAINEDRVFDCAAARLWAVADGMGGHRGGGQAAQAVVHALRPLTQASSGIALTDLLNALQCANADIRHRNREQGLDSGATVVAALLHETSMHIVWAGDSRAYLLRDGELTLLTEDHSVVQELVSAGLLTSEMALRHPQSNVITRALGTNDRVDLDCVTVDVHAGDVIMICSDGLSRSLPSGQWSVDDPLEHMADRMRDHALQSDGSDNISLVVVHLLES